MIKNLFRIFILTAFLVAVVQTSAFAAWRSFRVMNQTGCTMSNLYISSANIWGENLLKVPLKNGCSINVPYRNDLNSNFALKVILTNGQYYSWTGNKRQNINGVRMITFYRDGDTLKVQKD